MTTKKTNVGFQTLALTDIHESTTNPVASSMSPSWPNLPKVSAARGLSSPSPFGLTMTAMKSSQERAVSVPLTLPR